MFYFCSNNNSNNKMLFLFTMTRPWRLDHLWTTANSEERNDNNEDTIIPNLTQEESAAAGIPCHQPSQTAQQNNKL